MPASNFLNLSNKTRFRLTLELYSCGSGLFASQAIFLRVPLLDLIITLLAALYIIRASSELKKHREPFTPRQKGILFGIQACFCCIVVLGLLALALLKHTPLSWIIFSLALVISLCSLFYGYEQLYKDETQA